MQQVPTSPHDSDPAAVLAAVGFGSAGILRRQQRQRLFQKGTAPERQCSSNVLLEKGTAVLPSPLYSGGTEGGGLRRRTCIDPSLIELVVTHISGEVLRELTNAARD